MKQVGKLKAAPKGWALTKSIATGRVNVGYDGNFHIVGTPTSMNSQIDAAKVKLLTEKDPGEPGPMPTFSGSIHSKDADPVEKKKYTDWCAHRYAKRQYDILVETANVEVFDCHPIFESILVFAGYRRGRSSVTLEFYASNGQTIEFGPSGIDALISSIIQGQTKIVDATGVVSIDTFEYKDGVQTKKSNPFEGNGIRARFVFEKKGANIYANVKFKE